MKFKLGDCVKHIEYPKSKVPIHLSEQWHVDVINAQQEKFEHVSREEYCSYWKDESEC